jgi:hypothetical protein
LADAEKILNTVNHLTDNDEWRFPEESTRDQDYTWWNRKEPREQYKARINKCVMAEAVKKELGGGLLTAKKLWFDTMASHSITNDKELFGVAGPTLSCNVKVEGWSDNDNPFTVTECGMTVFGMMLYTPRAAGTILAGFEMKDHFILDWAMNDISVKATCKQDRTISFQFDMNPEDRILEATIGTELYNQIARDIFHLQEPEDDISDVKIFRQTLDQGSFKRTMESLHMHGVTCHTCMAYIATSADLKIMTNMPFSGRDARNVELMSDGKCPCCELAKSCKDSMNPNKSGDVSSQSAREEMPDIEYTSAADPSSRIETLGFDMMYIDGRPTLVGVGKNLGYVHAVSTTSRKPKVVREAMEMIIKDYTRFGAEVDTVQNGKPKRNRYRQAHPFNGQHRTTPVDQQSVNDVEGAEMDNEAAFVDAALDILTYKNKMLYKFAVAGEHISYVERAIRTIKERVAAMRCSLRFNVEKKMLSWLISNAVMWMNTLFSKRAPNSAWMNLTNQQLNYRDLTRTKFGDPVIAFRPGKLKSGTPRGELGLSMGANPRQPGAIFFYSFETGRIKSRLRFRTHIDIDSTKKFGVNKRFVEPAKVAQSYLKYVKNRNASLDELLEQEAIAMDTDDSAYGGLYSNSGGEIDDATPCFTREHGVDLKSSHTVTETQDTGETGDTEPDAIAMAVRVARATLLACKAGVTNKNISWARAIERGGDLGDTALAAINKELRQFVIEYDVCTPVSGHVENFHMSHALYDELKDKARLVVGKKIRDLIIDYGVEVNSPTLNGKLVNLMLSTCIHELLDLEVWDVKGAFLKAPMHTPGVYVMLEKHIVTRMLALLESEDKEKHRLWLAAVKPDGRLIVEVKKGWYGLACSSMLWHKEISATLTQEAGYTQHPLEQCLYYRVASDGSYSYIMLHVDDLGVMIKPGDPERDRLKNILENKYEALKIQRGDKVKYIGFEISRNRVENRFELTMTDYINRMCEQYNVGGGSSRVVKNPATSDDFAAAVYDREEDNKPYSQIAVYRSLVMSMQYGTLVMPSIKYHVILLATRQVCPKCGDFKKAQRVLEYMRAQAQKPVYIYGHGDDPDIYVYADAAFDVYPDSHSHGGLSVFVGTAGGAVYNSSTKQKCITDSSTGAEIVSAVSGLNIGAYYRDILGEFGYKCRVIHYEDNMSCIALVDTGCVAHDKKERHMVRKINIMHEYFEKVENNAMMLWCDTAWMIADGLTKDLHGQAFEISENVLMGHPVGDTGDYGVRRTKSDTV